MPELICFAVFCNVSEYLIAELGRGVCTRFSRHAVVWLVLAIRFLLRFCLVWFYLCQSVNGWVQSIPFSSFASSLSFLALLPLTVPLSDSDHVMDLSVCLPWSCLSLSLSSLLHHSRSHYSRFPSVRFTSDSLSFIPLPHSPERDNILSFFFFPPTLVIFLQAVQTTPLSSLFRLMSIPCFHIFSLLCFYCQVLKVKSQR